MLTAADAGEMPMWCKDVVVVVVVMVVVALSGLTASSTSAMAQEDSRQRPDLEISDADLEAVGIEMLRFEELVATVILEHGDDCDTMAAAMHTMLDETDAEFAEMRAVMSKLSLQQVMSIAQAHSRTRCRSTCRAGRR